MYLTGFAMKDAIDAAGIPSLLGDSQLHLTIQQIHRSPELVMRPNWINQLSVDLLIFRTVQPFSFLGGNGILVDGAKVQSPNTPIIKEEVELNADNVQPEQGKSMVAAAFTMVSFGGIGWRVINDGYSQVVSCFQIFCRYGSLAQSGGYLSITNSATNSDSTL